MQQQVMRLKGNWTGMPVRAQLAIVGVIVVTLAVMFFVVKAATQTSWAPATDKLSPGKVSEAQGVLEKAGIPNQISSMGLLEVPKERAAEAAGKLAEANIAGAGAHSSCETMNGESGAFIASTGEQQRQRNRSCLQNEIANMIESVGSIESANVALTLPESELFTEEQTDAKASVTVDTGGSPLSAQHVTAISSLVVNAAKGMKAENVTIVDEAGTPYSSDGGSGSGSMSEAQLKLKIERNRNAEIETRLTQKFEEIAGSGKVKVISNVVLDMDDIRREVKDVGGAENERGPKVADKWKTEILNGAEDPVGGVAGTGTNINGREGSVIGGDTDEVGADQDNRVVAPIEVEGEGSPKFIGDEGATTYSNDEVREAIKVAQGTTIANRLSVVVDTSVKPETANAVKNAAQTFLGGNAADSFSLDQAPIARLDEQRATTERFEGVTGYAKWALLGLGLIGMAFFLRRALNARTQELLYPMDDMLALDPPFEPIPLRELEAAVSSASSMDSVKRLELERKVTMIAQEKPSEVAQMLRGWLHDTDGNYKRSA